MILDLGCRNSINRFPAFKADCLVLYSLFMNVPSNLLSLYFLVFLSCLTKKGIYTIESQNICMVHTPRGQPVEKIVSAQFKGRHARLLSGFAPLIDCMFCPMFRACSPYALRGRRWLDVAFIAVSPSKRDLTL